MKRVSRALAAWRTVRDLFWATLDDPLEPVTIPERTAPDGISTDVLRSVCQQLIEELATEVDRKKVVEGKLSTIVSIAPVPVTILLAVVTFLSSGRAQNFTGPSIVIITLCAFLVALQFLRALLAAIRGLSRMAYWAPRTAMPSADGPTGPYSRDACNDLLKRIESYRMNTDEKVSQLALAHTSMRNAVIWLIAAIAVLGFVTVSESFKERPASTNEQISHWRGSGSALHLSTTRT